MADNWRAFARNVGLVWLSITFCGAVTAGADIGGSSGRTSEPAGQTAAEADGEPNAEAAGPAGHSSARPTDRPQGAISCFVSILPLAYFVEHIGGERVDIDVMVGPGQSPATYEPTAKQLSRLAGARIYFAVGVPFEASLLPRVEHNFKNVTIVDTRAGIDPVEPRERGSATHGDTRGDNDDAVGSRTGDTAQRSAPDAAKRGHHHGALDPHVWLSPRLAKSIAVTIRDALSNADPAHRQAYHENCSRLIDGLEDLDREIRTMLAPFEGRRFYVFHPAFGHFAAEYGLEQVAVEFEGGSPGPKHLAAVIEQAKADNVEILFVQPQFSTSTAEMIAGSVGAKIVTLDPLSRNYASNLVDIARRIAGVLEDGHQ